jgi:hypothetical protein
MAKFLGELLGEARWRAWWGRHCGVLDRLDTKLLLKTISEYAEKQFLKYHVQVYIHYSCRKPQRVMITTTKITDCTYASLILLVPSFDMQWPLITLDLSRNNTLAPRQLCRLAPSGSMEQYNKPPHNWTPTTAYRQWASATPMTDQSSIAHNQETFRSYATEQTQTKKAQEMFWVSSWHAPINL